MPKTFYPDIIKALKAKGFSNLRQGKGSHEVWYCEKMEEKVIVPHNITSRHTANGIMKSAKIKKHF